MKLSARRMSKHGILSNPDKVKKARIKVEDSFRVTIQWLSGSALSTNSDEERLSCTIRLADLFALSPTEEGTVLSLAGFNCLALGIRLLRKAK